MDQIRLNKNRPPQAKLSLSEFSLQSVELTAAMYDLEWGSFPDTDWPIPLHEIGWKNGVQIW